jgi:hypothetical protein
MMRAGSCSTCDPSKFLNHPPNFTTKEFLVFAVFDREPQIVTVGLIGALFLGIALSRFRTMLARAN